MTVSYWPPAPTVTRRSEKLFEFVRGTDRFACELHYWGEWGVEAQLYLNEDLFVAHMFQTRDLAVAWALAERKAIEKGWTQ